MEALTSWQILDLLLISALLALAWTAMATKDLRRAVALFIAFGLLLALTWVRLRAPDIALAEAAIGAGLTGALLLAAARDEPDPVPSGRISAAGVVLTVVSAGLAVVLGWVFVATVQQADSTRLAEEVFANVETTGVSNPVTSVLLNFRAYDTLLELAVLLIAVLGVLALGPARVGYGAPGPVLSLLARRLVPLIILVSGYLLWAGAHAPGGAFQAGALLAAAGVLLRLTGTTNGGLPGDGAFRTLIVAGVAVFLAVGLSLMLAGRPFLGFPVAWAGSLILAIETAATLSIAAILLAAFLAGDPKHAAANRGSKTWQRTHKTQGHANEL